ncbi:hypothetical protein [Streptomyces sp. NPDC058374]|uniref:hypothetical protein n=1 Tax=Streptomyces sp. NPDC058374 TaxID=3346466 RepID=UPI003661B438
MGHRAAGGGEVDAVGPERVSGAAWREDGRTRPRHRFQQAVDEGGLPSGADPELFTRYVMTVATGIAVQAAGGAGRSELRQVADAASRNWPPV